MQGIRHFLLALQFFTRIPVKGRLADWVGYSPAMLRASAAHFPGIGYIVGGIAAVVVAGLLMAMPVVPASPWVTAVASIAVSAYVTGAFHEDGLADLADGLGGSYDRTRALEIMKDSRIGSFGAMALVLALLLKAGLIAVLAQLSPLAAVSATLVAAVVSRFMPLCVILTMAHVGNEGRSKSKPLADRIDVSAWVTGALWCVPVLAASARLWAWAPWLGGLAGALVALAWMWHLLNRRLQGFTGDGLGATQQVSEIGFLLGVCLLWPVPATVA